MSTATAPQFTPGQILQAGQRAESEGQLEHARQYYNHLIDHYGQSLEGQAAKRHLTRLAGGVPPPGRNRREPPPRPLSGPTKDAGAPRPVARRGQLAPPPQWVEPSTTAGPRDRIGRVLAVLVSLVGWLLIAGGGAMVILSVAGSSAGLIERGPVGLAVGLFSGVAGVALGLTMLLVARIARTVLDGSERMRQLLAAMRVRSDT